MATTKLMTAEDLWLMDDDEHRYDLVRGELIKMAPAGGDHGKIGLGIASRIWNHVYQQKLGNAYNSDTGFILARNPDVLLCPDASYVQTDRVPPKEKHAGFLEVAPDLVVEVVSPSDRMNDVTEKVKLYLDTGTQLVWIVQPPLQTVTVHCPDRTSKTFTAADTLDGGDVLPGFRLSLAELFS